MTDLPFPVHAVPSTDGIVDAGPLESRWIAIARAMIADSPDAPTAWEHIRPFMQGGDMVATGQVDGGTVELRLMAGPTELGPYDLAPEWTVRVGGAAILEALRPSARSLELREMHMERAAHVVSSLGMSQGEVHSATPWSEGYDGDLVLPNLLRVHLMVGGMVEHVRIRGFVAKIDAEADPVLHLRRIAAWKQRPEYRP